jgi:hypothetical protein
MTFEGLKNCRTLRVVDARNYRQGNGDQRPILEERPAPQVSAGRAAKAAGPLRIGYGASPWVAAADVIVNGDG